MTDDFEFDAFIAYAQADAACAEKLHTLLSTVGYRVFLAPRTLDPGVDWSKEINAALVGSLVTVVLVSPFYDAAYYLKAEVETAIELMRLDKRRRVVPVYLSPDRGLDGVPSFLRPLQSLSLQSDSAFLEVAHRLEGVLRQLRRGTAWEVMFDPKTVAIVTGCDYRPETFDRPAAYLLQRSIERAQCPFDTPFLRSVVFGDIWLLEWSGIPEHKNVISIGSAGANRLTGIIAGSGELVRSGSKGKWRVMRDGRRWAVFGDAAEDTRAAVESFQDKDLPAYLAEVWSSRE